ncbi:putative RING-type domain-containing protein [Seiridium cardinale]
MAEAQAIDRIHRIGQEQDVEVIRYIVSGSIEKYVQWVQKDKLRIIKDTFSTSEQSNEKVTRMRWKKLLAYLQ